MRIFNCDHCGQPVFFENVQCLKCGHALAYLPKVAEVSSLDPVSDGLWKSSVPAAEGQKYRLCQNYTEHNVCNWAVAEDDPNPLCISCRLTDTIPNLETPGNIEKWFAMEVAKRRMVYSLLALDLPVTSQRDDPDRGLTFKFLADLSPEESAKNPVLTGHADGVITVNLAEADDAEREKRRLAMHEPYRTLLGHMRHEVGHYYWDRLVRDSGWLPEYREVFGDETEDYGEALKRHYKDGAPADWQDHFISSYASVHSWEDWAETWAHYLHITDTLEMATDCQITIHSALPNRMKVRPRFTLHDAERASFDTMITTWLAISYVLNSLNRGLGLKDSYPFVLSEPVVAKLKFVHRVCTENPPE